MDTKRERGPRKRWAAALKREIVAATYVPGASVSVVARQYDVNANQVFSWRRLYRSEVPAAPDPAGPGLVPVTITAEPACAAAVPPQHPPVTDTIEIEVSGSYRVRVGASFDPRALRRVLDCLGGGR